jgi:hypothetical protein
MTEKSAVPRLSRRRLLKAVGGLTAMGSISLAVACTSRALSEALEDVIVEELGPEALSPTQTPTPPPPTPTPEPFIVAEGVQEHVLMAGSQYQSRLYVFGTGRPGNIILALGGVHGNEPGGWLAAEQVVDYVRPDTGALLVIPRANRLATFAFVRTTDDMGDLNRMYPGDPEGIPMARMAYEIMNVIRDYHVNYVVDLHESWAFWTDRTATQGGTAFLGQTIATSFEGGVPLARQVVENVNTRVRYSHETMHFREFGLNRPPGSMGSGGRSSLSIPNHAPGLVSLLVEMGQQQALERRIALHVDVLREIMRQVGVLTT